MTDQKITFGQMRASGVTGILVYCSDLKCGHHIKMDSSQWGDNVRLSDIEPMFICQKCRKRGADVRPDFPPVSMGTR